MVVHDKSRRSKATENSEAQPKAPKFSSGGEVHSFLRSQNQNVTLEGKKLLQLDLHICSESYAIGLKALRNQLSLKSGEESVSTNDERLRIVQEWLEVSPGAQDIFSLIENQNQVSVAEYILHI